jgi:hypothetical protein
MITPYSPYVYLGTNISTGKFYIGVRYAHSKYYRTPEQDLGIFYYTSSKIVKPVFAQFEWAILGQFETKEDALAYEESIINEHWYNPLLLNKNKRGSSFRRPDNYARKPYRKKDRSANVKALWDDPEFRTRMTESRNRTHTTTEFKQAHSIAMKKVSQESKNVRRVCRVSDRKEMTVQNFFRYLS